MIQTKYITLDEFLEFSGIDLVAQFENDKTQALAFLKRVEMRMESFIAVHFFKNIDRIFCQFNDYQKEHYKRALLEQTLYVFKNGDISVDSGFDPEQGEIANNRTLTSKTISRNAKDELIICGIWSGKLTYGYSNFSNWWWF